MPDYKPQLDRIEQRLNLLTSLTLASLSGGQIIMADLSQLQAQVQANANAEDSAILLIQGLAAQIAAAATDPAQVAALAAQLKQHADALAAAVVANTPVAPPAPTPPGG